MRTTAWRALGLTLALGTYVVTGCQAAEDERPVTGATTEAAADVLRVPAGNYQKVITMTDARALGLRASARELELGPDGTQSVTLTFADSYWSMSADYNGDPPQVGAYGTITYEDGVRAYVIDEPCCGSSRFTWELEGDRLEIEMDLDHLLEQNPDLRRASDEVQIGRLLVAGTFTRVD